MIILEGKEAVDYLDRTRSCIHPDDKFSNLPLLARMLDVQKAYLEGCMEADLKQVSRVVVNATGFAEIASWWVDIKNGLKMVDAMKEKRATALIPLLRQFANASRQGIVQEGEKLSRVLSGDCRLAEVIRNLSDEELGYMKDLQNGSRISPIYQDSKRQGLLIAENLDSAFQTIGEQHKNFSEVPASAGLKFIDGNPRTNRPPFIIYAFFDKGKITQHTLLTPGSSVSSRAECNRIKCLHGCIGKGYATIPDKHDVRLLKSAPFCEDVYLGCKEVEDIGSLRARVLENFLAADLTNFDDPTLCSLIWVYSRLNRLIDKMTGLYETKILGGSIFRGGDFTAENAQAADELQSIYDSLPYDDMKLSFQVVLGSVLRDLEKTAEHLASSAKTRKRRFWGFLPARPPEAL